jgi:tRNA threonylcarbamoyladenosine biosynthesis protein TsaE
MIRIAQNIDQLSSIALDILNRAGKRKIILFNGEMGAGKTTLIKEICLKLGVKENVSSPTFGIINTYKGIENDVHHFDAYRIENESEAYDIGVEDYLFSDAWCLIEWAEKIKGFLPSQKEFIEVDIKIESNTRIYKFD